MTNNHNVTESTPDKFYCPECDVLFVDPTQSYYDVTTCPGCEGPAHNPATNPAGLVDTVPALWLPEFLS